MLRSTPSDLAVLSRFATSDDNRDSVLMPGSVKDVRQTATPRCTVVTMVDEAYYWGAFLLVSSIRKSNIPCHIAVRTRGQLPEELCQGLAQFGDVSVEPLVDDNPRSLNLLKPQAMLQALDEVGGDFITWLDADCILIGETWDRLQHPFVAANEEMFIRQREVPENMAIYRQFYGPDDTRGSIPRKVLSVWKEDVGERELPRFRTKFVTNVLSIHRGHSEFLKAWASLIGKVVPEGYQGTLNFNSPAYHITDESALNALLLFGHEVPAVSDYPLNKDLDCYLAHFIDSPKPWHGWSYRNRLERQRVYELIDWVRKKDLNIPGTLPEALDETNALRHSVQTWADGIYRFGRHQTGQLLKKVKRLR